MPETDLSGRKRRHAADNLRIGATALIILGLWSSVQMYANLLDNWGPLQETLQLAQTEGMAKRQLYLVLFMTLLMITAAVMAVHLYIGLSARAFAAGKKRVPPYRILAGLMAASAAISVIVSLFDLVTEEESRGNSASVIINLTLIYALLSIIVHTTRLKKLRREKAAALQAGKE